MGATGALTPGVTGRRAVLLAGAALAGCALGPREDPALAAAVEATVQPFVQQHRFSGAVALMRDDRLSAMRAWGLADRALGLPFTPATPCDAASLAKNFTAAGIWQLVHGGRLQLQQPVQGLVPEYPHAGVTVWHLLAHSSGLVPDYSGFDAHFRPGELRTTAGLLALAGRDAPAPRFAPGTRFEYADLAYDALGLVIERASGEPYAGYVQRQLFRPHGLSQAFARPARLSDWPVPRTRGYRFDAGRWVDDDAYDGEAFLGGSNLILSAQDLVRWGNAWAHGRVLPAAVTRAAHARPLLGDTRSAIDLLGWYGTQDADADTGPRRGHNTGEYNGFRAHVHWDRRRRESVAFVSNSAFPARAGEALVAALVGLLSHPARPA